MGWDGKWDGEIAFIKHGTGRGQGSTRTGVFLMNAAKGTDCEPLILALTRFGPNRPAADTEGNGEFDF